MRELLRRPLRLVLSPAIAAVLLLSMGAADTSVRYEDVGHKMMCVCGCNEILLECNHEGCPDSSGMISELNADISKGMSNTAIFEAFQNEYGPTVLAAPMLTRFNMVAWIVPPALLLLGIFGVVFLVRKWRLRAATVPAPAAVAHFDLLRDRIRKETEL